MKTRPPNAQPPQPPDPERDDGLARFRRTASRVVSRLAVILLILLLIDIGFVLVESSLSANKSADDPQIAVVSITMVATTEPPTSAPTTVAPTASVTPFPLQSATPAPARATARPTSQPKQAAPAAKSTVLVPTPKLYILATETTQPAQASTRVTSTATVITTATAGQSAPAGGAADTCDNPVGQLITDTIDSKILGHPLPVQVYLPPCYDGARYSYPTLYLIQGSAYNLGEWVDDGATRVADLQMSLGLMAPFIIVMPGNDLRYGNGSIYLYSSGGKGSWEDFFLNELIPMTEAKYSTWQTREGRAIGGISRGGYWSLEIAFTHPDLFSAIGGHSPSITSDQLIGTPANFSMLSYVKSFDTLKESRIFIDAGSTDWTQRGVSQLSKELTAKGVTYLVSTGEGGHEDGYWSSRVPDYLAFYSSNWPRVPQAKPGSAGVASDNLGAQP